VVSHFGFADKSLVISLRVGALGRLPGKTNVILSRSSFPKILSPEFLDFLFLLYEPEVGPIRRDLLAPYIRGRGFPGVFLGIYWGEKLLLVYHNVLQNNIIYLSISAILVYQRGVLFTQLPLLGASKSNVF